MYKTAVYPGTFDPITNGHIEVIKKAINIFDNLIIAIAINENKKPLFTPQERKNLIEDALNETPHKNIQVKIFDNLLVDFCKTLNAKVVIRGLRVISDFEYEFQMACINSRMYDEIETIFIPASDKTQFISSRVVKEIARNNEYLYQFVPNNVQNALKIKFSN